MVYSGRFGSLTDIGLVRPTNEDKALSIIDAHKCVLLCVCDGMGGQNKGDFASKIAVDHISNSFKNKNRFLFGFQVKHWLERTIKAVNASIWKETETVEKLKGMGTTVCLAVLFKNRIYILNVGDSRCYKCESDDVVQLTKDQSLVEHLAATGQIRAEEKLTDKNRHALMNYVGMRKDVNYVITKVKNDGKIILLCSDGLYNNASNRQIFSALSSTERLDQKINTLVGIAKTNGGTDNIAIAMWEPNKHD